MSKLRYLSVCSGIEAASVAWDHLGWTPAGFSEIDKFASAVLAARFGSNLPGEAPSRNAPPNFGDFTAIPLDTLGHVDLLVGGTPCQAFSFAGKRLSLDDARGNLTLAFAVLAHELAGSHGLRNVLWENVPGVLSTDDNAFGCFLGALVGADAPLDLPKGIKRWPDAGMVAGPRARAAWRVLDAQYFGLAQRRERVFVVVDFGNGADPAAVLFEPQGMQGNSAPRREAGQRAAATITASTGGCSGKDGIDGRLAYGGGNRSGSIEVAATLTAKGQKCDFEVETFIADVAGTLPAGANGTGGNRPPGMGQETADTYLIAFDTTQITSAANRSNPKAGDPCHPVAAQAHAPAIAFSIMPQNSGKDYKAREVDVAQPLMAGGPVGGNQGGDFVLQPVAFDLRNGTQDDIAMSLQAGGMGEGRGLCPNAIPHTLAGWAVRRLTPVECARLQGFPDHHSRIAWRGKPADVCPDGPQYKTYGNSMAVNVMSWLGEQIATHIGGHA
jgi:DNA (cytosine-5)-methyltransferase 1